MARMEVNRSGEMEVFVRAVDLGGFSAAARALRLTPSAVSKLVARLESRLGARLVNRSTRKLQLTPEGAAFYDRAVRVLADLDEAERGAASGAVPRGRLRVNTSVPFGTHRLIPLLPGFLARHPEVTVEVTLTDAVVDLLEDRADVAIRVGPLKSSQLVARKLAESRMVLVAAPAYLDRHGTPRSPEDLARHNLLGFSFARQSNGWPFRDREGNVTVVVPTGNAQVSDGESMRLLVLTGLGISRLSRIHVGPDMEAGRLVPVLEAYNPGDMESIHAVYVGGGHLPARVRAFLDYLVEILRPD
ncbi:LysR family transcriptional regulator [Microvirga terrae]|uniref:LysR family transcriptional regulator n=1 Tax=Microvirga terrae TaxID=2740529 RepID=A0ABY5RWH0_9HYPH|nr:MULTISPECIES: LysR family transcriptional regulator [Microvirga]MBQ0822565.1 LysR family transcriptional regulator [Microvirga sp. HBU67558]UVF20137.1 LysR family transcriptional regulator [Microvirga terrae]